MLAKISDNQWVYLDQIPIGFEDVLAGQFSVKSPHQRFLSTESDWDGVYRKYSHGKQRLRLPFLNELKQLCKRKKVPLQIQDFRESVETPDPAQVQGDWLPDITLEQYQIDAIRATCEHECGIFSVVTGGGKTELMAGITKLFNVPTVIFADQRIVIDQIKHRLELRDVADVGLFYGGKRPNGQTVIVGSIQSLATPPSSMKQSNPDGYRSRRKNAKIFQKIVAKAQLLLIDECDRAGNSAQWKKLCNTYYKGRRRYGFSGTPFDEQKPVDGLFLREHLGSIIYSVSRKTVESLGRIIPVKHTAIAIGEDKRTRKVAFDIAERECIIENQKVHEVVKLLCDKYPNDGTRILVDTCNITDLGHTLQAMIPGSKFIYGKTSKTARNDALDEFESRQMKVLIAGKILKRGLDLKGGCENLIILGGGKLHSDFDQKVGRAVRRNQRGWARIFTFLHLDNFYLYRHGKESLKAILNMEYDSNIIFPGGKVVPTQKFVRSWRLPKSK